MKKALIAFGVVIMFGIGLSMSIRRTNDNAKSSLQFENLEALANDETSEGEILTCYNDIHKKEGSKVCYCPLCEYIPGAADFLASSSLCSSSNEN